MRIPVPPSQQQQTPPSSQPQFQLQQHQLQHSYNPYDVYSESKENDAAHQPNLPPRQASPFQPLQHTMHAALRKSEQQQTIPLNRSSKLATPPAVALSTQSNVHAHQRPPHSSRSFAVPAVPPSPPPVAPSSHSPFSAHSSAATSAPIRPPPPVFSAALTSAFAGRGGAIDSDTEEDEEEAAQQGEEEEEEHEEADEQQQQAERDYEQERSDEEEEEEGPEDIDDALAGVTAPSSAGSDAQVPFKLEPGTVSSLFTPADGRSPFGAPSSFDTDDSDHHPPRWLKDDSHLHAPRRPPEQQHMGNSAVWPGLSFSSAANNGPAQASMATPPSLARELHID